MTNKEVKSSLTYWSMVDHWTEILRKNIKHRDTLQSVDALDILKERLKWIQEEEAIERIRNDY